MYNYIHKRKTNGEREELQGEGERRGGGGAGVGGGGGGGGVARCGGAPIGAVYTSLPEHLVSGSSLQCP